MYQGNSAIMFHDRSAETFHDSNVKMFHGNSVKMFPDNNAKMFQKMYAKTFQDNNVETSQGKYANKLGMVVEIFFNSTTSNNMKRNTVITSPISIFYQSILIFIAMSASGQKKYTSQLYLNATCKMLKVYL